MGRFVARRLLQAIPTMFGIMLVSFILLRVSPADPVKLMVPSDTEITEADKDRLRAAFGLDKPLPVQFIDFTVQAATLDFGKSFYYHRPARDMIFERIPNSIQPVVLGLLVGVFLGIPLGFIAALNRGRRTDHGIRVTSVVLNATPDFFLGLLFVLFLAIQFKWFPIGSMNVVGVDCTLCWDRAWHLVGPVLLYANAGIAFYPRLIRTEVLEVLGQDFVRTARAKGLRERVVMSGHVLRNALIPVVTNFGGILTIVFAGNVIVERVFNWPGLGRLFFDSLIQKDYPIIQASLVMGAGLLLISYILRDITYALIDPRIKVR
ncbi:MAG: ABC transporter permease [Chloroflexi bacterium]|nr:ABC transporter permease [Chloroflexota bacterium]